jgi:hypothetical protein
MWPHRTYLIDKLCDHITRDIDATSGAESAFLAYLYFDFKDTEKQGPRFVIIPYSALFSPCIPLTKMGREPRPTTRSKCVSRICSQLQDGRLRD